MIELIRRARGFKLFVRCEASSWGYVLTLWLMLRGLVNALTLHTLVLLMNSLLLCIFDFTYFLMTMHLIGT